jgi:hypothetical protein
MTLRDADGFILLYDFLDEPPRLFLPLVFFGFAVFGFFLIKSSLKPSATVDKDLLGVKNSTKKGVVGLLAILLGLSMGFWSLNIPDYFRTRSICKKGDFSIVSGPVTNLIINNKGKNDNMEFYVQGQRFMLNTNDFRHYGCTYSDFDRVNIQDSTFLKIAYMLKDGQNIILRAQTK